MARAMQCVQIQVRDIAGGAFFLKPNSNGLHTQIPPWKHAAPQPEQASLQFGVTCVGICPLAFPAEKVLCHAIVDVIPGQNLIEAAAAVGIKFRIHAAVGKGAPPALEREIIIPAVKFAAQFMGAQEHRSQAPVPSGKHCFHKAGVGVVVVAGYLFRFHGLQPGAAAFRAASQWYPAVPTGRG